MPQPASIRVAGIRVRSAVPTVAPKRAPPVKVGEIADGIVERQAENTRLTEEIDHDAAN